jgi:ubiquitin-conjugating enzyme E2 I
MALRMNRLSEERKQWRGDHPFSFYPKSICENGGVMDLKSWTRLFGRAGYSRCALSFQIVNLAFILPSKQAKIMLEYPTKPPKCNIVIDISKNLRLRVTGQFVPPLFHPNIYPSSTVCLSILIKMRVRYHLLQSSRSFSAPTIF